MKRVRAGWYSLPVVHFEEAIKTGKQELTIDVSKSKTSPDWIVSTRPSVYLRQQEEFVASFCTYKGASAFAKEYKAYLLSDELPRPRAWEFE